MDDDLVAKYAAEAKAAMEAEAHRRVAESVDPEEEARLRNLSLASIMDTEHAVPALLARLGPVRAGSRGYKSMDLKAYYLELDSPLLTDPYFNDV